jgi:tRNA1Val (adenine37-N6)-methyltransferase
MAINKGFRFKQFTVHDDKCQMKVGTDGVLLGAWAGVENVNSILDIGTGSGLISLMLAQRTSGSVHIDAVEPAVADASQAQANVLNSPWADRVSVHAKRIQDYQPDTRYDLIVTNPPFFSSSLLPPSVQRASARHTLELTQHDLLAAAARLLKETGSMAIILPVKEGDMFVQNALNNGFYVARSLAFHTIPGKHQERWLLEIRRGPQQVKQERMTLYGSPGIWSDEYSHLVRDFYLQPV